MADSKSKREPGASSSPADASSEHTKKAALGRLQLEKMARYDRFEGSPADVVAAGLVRADQMPGQTGMPKTAATFYAGTLITQGNSRRPHDENYLHVSLTVNRAIVSLGISVAERASRESAQALRQSDNASTRPSRPIEQATRLMVPKWSDIAPEDMGYGQVSGHTLARDLMRLAQTCAANKSSAHWDSVRGAIKRAMKGALLSELEDSSHDATRNYAAAALWSDMTRLLIYAAEHANYEEFFLKRVADAQPMIKTVDEIRERHLREQRQSEGAAAEAVRMAMRRC